MKRDQLLQEEADHDRRWEEHLRGVLAEWSARGELLHPGTSEAKAHGMLKDVWFELDGSHPLETPEEATARLKKAEARFRAVNAIIDTLGHL